MKNEMGEDTIKKFSEIRITPKVSLTINHIHTWCKRLSVNGNIEAKYVSPYGLCQWNLDSRF